MLKSVYEGPRAGDPPRRSKRPLIALLAVTLLAFSAFLVSPASATAPASEPRAARYEVHFMTHMIDHHHMAVMMTGICLQEVDIDPEFRELCQTMLTDQSQEITLMQSWLQDWYGMPYGPQMMPGHAEMMAQLAALDGDQFEIEFLEMMAGHHLDAVREADRCLRVAEHDELVDLCSSIRTTQMAEVVLMRSWLCEWHDICRDRERIV